MSRPLRRLFISGYAGMLLFGEKYCCRRPGFQALAKACISFYFRECEGVIV